MGPDLAVDQQAVAALERAHGAHRDRAVVPVGRDAERALNDGDRGAAVVQPQDDRAGRDMVRRAVMVRPAVGRAAMRVLCDGAAQPDVQRPGGVGPDLAVDQQAVAAWNARTARTVTGP